MIWFKFEYQMKKIPLLIAAVCMLTLLANHASADDGMDARTHSKVMRAKRMQAIDKNANADNPSALPAVGAQQNADPCSAGIGIGNVYVDKNGRNAPRENTVVVTGDVIFAPGRNCR